MVQWSSKYVRFLEELEVFHQVLIQLFMLYLLSIICKRKYVEIVMLETHLMLLTAERENVVIQVVLE